MLGLVKPVMLDSNFEGVIAAFRLPIVRDSSQTKSVHQSHVTYHVIWVDNVKYYRAHFPTVAFLGMVKNIQKMSLKATLASDEIIWRRLGRRDTLFVCPLPNKRNCHCLLVYT
jgi:hypothetical protein